jgi:hypothetical protein
LQEGTNKKHRRESLKRILAGRVQKKKKEEGRKRTIRERWK